MSVHRGERILPTAVIEKFAVNANGELEPLTAGSTRPVAATVTHAGICKVKRYGFEIAGRMSAVGGTAENIGSLRVFRFLTHNGHVRTATP
jgi:hypothetical protein